MYFCHACKDTKDSEYYCDICGVTRDINLAELEKWTSDPSHNESILAIKANRLLEAASNSIFQTDGQEKSLILSKEAVKMAFLAGYLYPDNPVPALFAHAEILSSPYLFAQTKRLRDEVLVAVNEQHIAQDKWEVFGLPDPESVLQRLREGETIKLHGYKLESRPVSRGFENAIWHINENGINTCLGTNPGVQSIKDLMTTLVRTSLPLQKHAACFCHDGVCHGHS